MNSFIEEQLQTKLRSPKAIYPLEYVKENKFWPSVRRVDEAFGDRNLVCSCSSINEFIKV